ncbi:IS30 family transposase [Pasteurella testudinis]|uniref:IS30 family transposase n=1 Tax=Pasteurella testudinis TaxID=761 RepID=UPI004059074B
MSYQHLTQEQRYYIFLEYRKQSKSSIARAIGRDRATVKRELDRHSVNGEYDYLYAQQQYEAKKKKQTAHKMTSGLTTTINGLLIQRLSPEQVCGYLAKHHQISLHHETLYRHIRKDKASGGELYTYMRILPKPYRKKRGSVWTKGKVPDRVGIEERPAIVDEKTRIGDWEMDTIVGKDQKSGLLVATERKTKFTVARKINNFKAENTATAAINLMKKFKKSILTITLDNGKEFYRHKMFAKKLGAKTYFCRPYHSWEKGLVENTNGLLRQYFPKQTDFNSITDEEIEKVVDEINHRPRKTLDYDTPSNLFLGVFKPLTSVVALGM